MPRARRTGELSPFQADSPVGRANPSAPAEQTRLPLSYVADRMPVADGWSHSRHAYLAFGDTYRRERRAAADLGWPVRTLPGHHLLMLAEPALVASAVEELVGEMGIELPR